MIAPAEASAELPMERLNFAFSADGTVAACLSSTDVGDVGIEVWTFAERCSDLRRVPLDPAQGAPSFVTPLDRVPAGGRTHSRPGVVVTRAVASGVYELVLVEIDGERALQRSFGTVACTKLRVWSCPDPATAAVVVGRTGDRDASVWRVRAAGGVVKVCDLPGAQLLGGGWTDTAGTRLGVNVRDEHGRAYPVDVRMADGEVTPARTGREGGNEILQLAAPAAGLRMYASDAGGPFRFALHTTEFPDGWFPGELNRIDGSVLPLTVDDAGERVLLHVSRGVRAQLISYDIGGDRCVELPLPLGALAGPARFAPSGQSVRMAFSTSDRITGIHTVGLDPREPLFRNESAGPPGFAARLERFDGPAGAIEALVYGDDWRTAQRLLIALHGGPEDAWRPRFDPLFQRLVQDGIAVIAPNQRGSTQYGEQHQNAIYGAWGGPDLDDIRHIARKVAAARNDTGEMLLYGHSYGAYLALLTAAVEPDLWSRCAVVAPFLSGSRLWEVAAPSVRRLLERLDGRAELMDDLGTRDAWRLVPAVAADLLVVHGGRDAVIPVAQSRELMDRLSEAGRVGGAGVHYLELPDEGHYPLRAQDGTPMHRVIVDFLRCGELTAASSRVS